MPAQDKSDLFEFMLERVKETQKRTLDASRKRLVAGLQSYFL